MNVNFRIFFIQLDYMKFSTNYTLEIRMMEWGIIPIVGISLLFVFDKMNSTNQKWP
jgi:hypothetical protein